MKKSNVLLVWALNCDPGLTSLKDLLELRNREQNVGQENPQSGQIK